jgi:hypothetical protein
MNMTQKIKVGDYVKVIDESGNYAYSGMLGKVLCVEKVFTSVNGLDIIVCEGFIGAGMYSFYFELVAPPKADKTFTLELTEDEVNTVYSLMGRVLGGVENSPRKHSNSVFYKIADILHIDASTLVETGLLDGKIRFKDYPVVKTPQQLKIEELENTIKEAQKKLEELKGL